MSHLSFKSIGPIPGSRFSQSEVRIRGIRPGRPWSLHVGCARVGASPVTWHILKVKIGQSLLGFYDIIWLYKWYKL